MASPDGVGWPEEPASYSLGAARDESRLTAVGLGWPLVTVFTLTSVSLYLVEWLRHMSTIEAK